MKHSTGNKHRRDHAPRMQRYALWLGPLCGVLVPLLVPMPDYPKAPFMLGIVLWMALWWITECIPLAVTALLPLLVFPLTGIATTKEVAPRYMTSIIFLFIGGFLIAQAMEKTGLHRRIAVSILARWHASPTQILAGFAFTTALLSMWISNTATTMLMVTIGLAVLARLDERTDNQPVVARFAPILLLTIAYSANVGGMGTPVGTVPNLIFLETMDAFSETAKPSFLHWMMVGVPMVIAGLGVVLVVVGHKVRTLPWNIWRTDTDIFKSERSQLGPMRVEERCVAWVLGLTALAWLSRQGIQAESFAVPGWSALLPHPGVDDGSVAIAGAFALFLLRDQCGNRILDQQAISRLPWGVLILLGGGFALALGMQVSGLSQWLAGEMTFLAKVPLPLMLLSIALIMTFLTELTSNTAITQVMLPILAALAAGATQDMTLVLMAATLAASCAFMLPVATPPNAIVFATGRISMQAMMGAGIRLNIVMPFVIIAIISLFRPLMP